MGETVMAEPEWNKAAIFDPVLATQAQEQLRIEPPPDLDTPRAVSPPQPGVADQQQVAQLWRQMNTADPPPDDAATAAQLAMAIYLLQALHAKDKPGYSSEERRV